MIKQTTLNSTVRKTFSSTEAYAAGEIPLCTPEQRDFSRTYLRNDDALFEFGVRRSTRSP